MTIEQKYKGKATAFLGNKQIDVFDITKEQVKEYWNSLGWAREDTIELLWSEILQEREKVIRFTDGPKQ
jgi:hypothetical protein